MNRYTLLRALPGAANQMTSSISYSRPGLLMLAAVLLSFATASAAQTPAEPTNQAPPTSAAAPARHRTRGPVPRTKMKPLILIGAGDIAGCQNIDGAKATAKIIERFPTAAVFAAGDVVYERGTAEEFKDCYEPTWGKFKDRTRPALGNHEYGSPGAAPYFAYWGDKAGPVGKGYYSYDLGNWHIVALNTNCNAVGGCNEGSPQEVWLKEDLAQHSNACIIAYGHHALFSSGVIKAHAVHTEVKPLWDDLYAAHADLFFAGHEHSYERFAAQNPEGQLDPKSGIQLIVVGTGGRSHEILGFAAPNSELRNWDTYGVIKVEMLPTSYTWEFIPEAGKTFHDSGSGTCHNAPAPPAQ